MGHVHRSCRAVPVMLCPFPKARKRFSLPGSLPVVGVWAGRGQSPLLTPCCQGPACPCWGRCLRGRGPGPRGRSQRPEIFQVVGPKGSAGDSLPCGVLGSGLGRVLLRGSRSAGVGDPAVAAEVAGQTQPGDCGDPVGWLEPAPVSAACPRLSPGRGLGASSDTSILVPIPGPPAWGSRGCAGRRDGGSRQHPRAPRTPWFAS